MKKTHIKNKLAAISAFSMLFAACACNNTKIKTTEATTKVILTTETTKTTVPTSPEETATEDTTDGTSETGRLDIGSILGLENCYCELEEIAGEFCVWYFKDDKGRVIAEQFGFGYTDAPKYYIGDLNKDGIDELICDCEFGGDGALRTYIFRNNNDVIEKGYTDTDMITELTGDDVLTPGSYTMRYDPDNAVVVLRYNDAVNYELTMDNFKFEEYVPGN